MAGLGADVDIPEEEVPMMIRPYLTALFAVFAASPLASQASDLLHVIPTQSVDVSVERLAALEHPWGMTFLPDGRLLITEKPGRLRTYARGRLSEPIEGVPDVVFHEQGGLLDVEIDPDFAQNRLVYLYFTEAASQQPDDARLVPDPRLGPFVDTTHTVLKGGAVARGRLEGDELEDLAIIWQQEPKTIGMGHFGGRLVFGGDGTLFITSGERQRFDPAQDPGTNLGKVVRINPDGSIPDDNPFVHESGARPDIWTLGNRNPLGAALHPLTGELWIHEMGPLHGDELNLIVRGRNYGWPVVSEGDHYDGTPIPRHHTHREFEPPVQAWVPSIAPSGLTFYDGPMFPDWHGSVLIGGLVAEGLIRLTMDKNRVMAEERIGLGRRIRDVIQAPDGAVLLLVDGEDGELLRLTPSPAREP